MTRVVVDHKPERGDPLYGYATKWRPSECTTSKGRVQTTTYLYTVPDDVAAEMIEKGAKIDDRGGRTP